MQTEALSCSICCLPYDQGNHIPRVLPDCIHTLCSLCLGGILQSSKEIKCPFDNQALSIQSRNINDYKLNFALKDLIEEIARQRFCEIHQGEVVNLYCLSDQSSICNLCAYYEQHKGHEVIPLKVLEDETVNRKKQSDLIIKSLDEYKSRAEKLFEEKKKDLISQTQKKFKDFRLFLGIKELQVLHDIESFFACEEKMFEKNLGTNSSLHKSIQNRFAPKPENAQSISSLANQNNELDLNSIVSKFSPDNLSKFGVIVAQHLNGASQALNFPLLTETQSNLTNLQFPIKEFLEQTQKIYNHVSQDFEHFTSEKVPLTGESEMRHTDIEEEIQENFDINKAYLDKLRGDSLDLDEKGFCESTNGAISAALKQIQHVTSLKVDLVATNVTDSELSSLGLLLSRSPTHLKNLEVALTNCSLTDQSLSYLFEKVFDKVQHLKVLDIDLRNTKISTRGAKAVANFVAKNANTIEFFHIDLSKTELPDKLIAHIFPQLNCLRGFRVNLNSTKAADLSLDAITKNFSPKFLQLEYFELYLYETKVKDDNIAHLFKKMEKIKRFLLVLSHTKVTDATLQSFVINTLFPARTLEELELHFASTSVGDQSVTKLFDCVINLKNFVLNLESTKVSDKSIKSFISTTLPSINYKGELEMYLRNTKVTDKTRKLVMKKCDLLRNMLNK